MTPNGTVERTVAAGAAPPRRSETLPVRPFPATGMQRDGAFENVIENPAVFGLLLNR